jgi:drug/metabolite transporter (DMT)-like permease
VAALPVLLDEPLSLSQMFGTALVLIGVWLVSRK